MQLFSLQRRKDSSQHLLLMLNQSCITLTKVLQEINLLGFSVSLSVSSAETRKMGCRQLHSTQLHRRSVVQPRINPHKLYCTLTQITVLPFFMSDLLTFLHFKKFSFQRNIYLFINTLSILLAMFQFRAAKVSQIKSAFIKRHKMCLICCGTKC